MIFIYSLWIQHTDFTCTAMDKFVFLMPLLSAAASVFLDPDVVQVKPGDDVTLPCRAGDVFIRAVEWTRPDLEPDYVLFYKAGLSDPTYQHPSFKDRVQLVDRELKDGDVSLILKNVSRNDTGTYECRVAEGGSRHQRAIINIQPISIIQLEVSASGSNSGDVEEGNYGLYYGLGAAFVLVCLAAVGLAVGWKYKRHTEKKTDQPAADKTVNDQLLQSVSTKAEFCPHKDCEISLCVSASPQR